MRTFRPQQHQSTLPRSHGHGHQTMTIASGHHTIAICKNSSKTFGVAPPQPPQRASSNLTSTGGGGGGILVNKDKSGEHQHHQHQSGGGPSLAGGSNTANQVHLVSALQSNYNGGTNSTNTSTLKKRVQIQEVTV